MNRRDFLALTGAAALAGTLPALAQQGQVKRLGFVFTLPEADPEVPKYLVALREGLARQGWFEGRNLQIEYHWAVNNEPLSEKVGQDLASASLDLVLPVGFALNLSKVVRNTPIVFALVNEPLEIGLVDSMARPSGNATGFSNLEYSIAGKWLELLKELDAGVSRAGFAFDPASAAQPHFYDAFESAGRLLKIETVRLAVTTREAILPAVASLASQSGSGFVVGNSTLLLANRGPLAEALMGYGITSVWGHALYAPLGLATYCLDPFKVVGDAADYAGRVLNGTRIADLPVQSPNKFDLIVNMKIARAMGLTVPVSVLARADQVIE